MKQGPSAQRALRLLACASLLVGVFEACSGDDGAAPISPGGPPSLQIAGISLGHGLIDPGGAPSVLACDGVISVVLASQFWTYQPPGLCTVPQCGQVRVTLFDSDGTTVLATQVGAAKSIDLNASALSEGNHALSVEADLIDDSGKTVVVADGGNSTAKQSFELLVSASECRNGDASEGGAGGDSAGGAAGASEGGASEGGAGGDSAGGASGASTSAGASGA